MEDYIKSCEAKISRANELVLELEARAEKQISENEYVVDSYIDKVNRRYVFKLIGPNPPLTFSVIVGEIIHNLRSVFDYLVWGASSHKDSRVMFPVCDSKNKFKTAIKNGKLRGIDKKYENLVEEFQIKGVGDK